VLPITEALDRETLALPMSSELTHEDATLVTIGLEVALAEVRRLSVQVAPSSVP
jgi:hypothetical protein